MVPAKASLIPVGGDKIPVQFNPQSLQVTYQYYGTDGSKQCQKDAETQGARKQQTGNLASISMDLLFDTTEDGSNVCNTTVLLAALIQPCILNGNTAASPPLVTFSWGYFLFTGSVTQLSETIDFFSEIGVPLRSTVKMTMNAVEAKRGNPGVLAGIGLSASVGLSASAGVSVGAGAGIGFTASASLSAGLNVGGAPLTLSQAGDSLQALAGRAGVDAAWKTIASANNIDNPRNIPPGTPINLNAGVSGGAGVNFGSGS